MSRLSDAIKPFGAQGVVSARVAAGNLAVAIAASRGIEPAAIDYAETVQANTSQADANATPEVQDSLYVQLPANAADPLYVANAGNPFAPPGWWKTYQHPTKG
jgi:hypothetical protein